MHNVVSVDGFIADENDDVGPLHDWYFSGDTPITEGGGRQYDHSGGGSSFKASRASADYVRPMWEAIGTIVMGRNLFDLVNGWEGQPPAGDHVVVVSHRSKPEGWHPEASYHFVDGVTAAIDKARELAGERTIAVNAGDVGSQIFAAGLVDEVAMDVVPAPPRAGGPHVHPQRVSGSRKLANACLSSAVGTHTVDRTKVHSLGHTARLAVVDQPLPSP